MLIIGGKESFLEERLLAATRDTNTNCHGICLNEKD
jgi:hypothetical protein